MKSHQFLSHARSLSLSLPLFFSPLIYLPRKIPQPIVPQKNNKTTTKIIEYVEVMINAHMYKTSRYKRINCNSTCSHARHEKYLLKNHPSIKYSLNLPNPLYIVRVSVYVCRVNFNECAAVRLRRNHCRKYSNC